MGISAEDLKRIGVPSFRRRKPIAGGNEGTGPRSLHREVARCLHHGEVAVQSKLDVGTTIEIPVCRWITRAASSPRSKSSRHSCRDRGTRSKWNRRSSEVPRSIAVNDQSLSRGRKSAGSEKEPGTVHAARVSLTEGCALQGGCGCRALAIIVNALFLQADVIRRHCLRRRCRRRSRRGAADGAEAGTDGGDPAAAGAGSVRQSAAAATSCEAEIRPGDPLGNLVRSTSLPAASTAATPAAAGGDPAGLVRQKRSDRRSDRIVVARRRRPAGVDGLWLWPTPATGTWGRHNRRRFRSSNASASCRSRARCPNDSCASLAWRRAGASTRRKATPLHVRGALAAKAFAPPGP